MLIAHEDAQRAINGFANKLMRRWSAGGAPAHLIEDIKQELWIALLGAQQSFDPEKGASFNTYFYGAMKWHMRTWARENIHTRFQEIIGKSLDEEMSEDGDTFSNMLACSNPLPDELLIEEDLWAAAMTRLKPRTRLFMELLRDPPEELLAEVLALKARSEYSKSMGIPQPHSNRVTTALVFDLLGVNRHNRTLMMREIARVNESIERVSR